MQENTLGVSRKDWINHRVRIPDGLLPVPSLWGDFSHPGQSCCGGLHPVLRRQGRAPESSRSGGQGGARPPGGTVLWTPGLPVGSASEQRKT